MKTVTMNLYSGHSDERDVPVNFYNVPDQVGELAAIRGLSAMLYSRPFTDLPYIVDIGMRVVTHHEVALVIGVDEKGNLQVLVSGDVGWMRETCLKCPEEEGQVQLPTVPW